MPDDSVIRLGGALLLLGTVSVIVIGALGTVWWVFACAAGAAALIGLLLVLVGGVVEGVQRRIVYRRRLHPPQP